MTLQFYPYSLLQYSKVTALKVLKDDVKYVWKETFFRNYYLYLKAIVKIYNYVCSFSKARDIVDKFWVSESTEKKSLQKHMKSGICWQGNAYYPTFSYFTGWSFPGIFLFKYIVMA